MSNLNNLSIRMDRETGALWLVKEAPRKPIKMKDMTSHILLALCADLVAEDGTKEVSRDVKFNDTFTARIIIQAISEEDYEGRSPSKG